MLSELESLRAQLQQTNVALLELLSRRARLVTEVHRIKVREGIPVHVPEREREMLEELLRRNPGPLPEGAVRRLFEAIFSTSRDLQKRLRGEL
jgi:chorismate mutase-like protein